MRSAWLLAGIAAAALPAFANSAIAAEHGCRIVKDRDTLDAIIQGLGGAGAFVTLVSPEGRWVTQIGKAAAAAGLANAMWNAARSYFGSSDDGTVVCIDKSPSAPTNAYIGPPSVMAPLWNGYQWPPAGGSADQGAPYRAQPSPFSSLYRDRTPPSNANFSSPGFSSPGSSLLASPSPGAKTGEAARPFDACALYVSGCRNSSWTVPAQPYAIPPSTPGSPDRDHMPMPGDPGTSTRVQAGQAFPSNASAPCPGADPLACAGQRRPASERWPSIQGTTLDRVDPQRFKP